MTYTDVARICTLLRIEIRSNHSDTDATTVPALVLNMLGCNLQPATCNITLLI